MNTAEKIETIVLCHKARGTVSGSCGSVVPLADGALRVLVDGLTVIVKSTAHGWQVNFKGFAGIDRELYVAASNAFDGGSRRNVSTVEEALS